MNHLAGRHLLI